jgi:UDP-glucose 4-epimerase
MRALITGGAGFLGSQLYRLLLELGHDVIVLDDYSTGSLDNLRGVPGPMLNRRWHLHGSVTDEADVGRAMAMAPDVVFHLAAQVDVGASAGDPLHDADTNVMGTLRMLEASARAEVPRFVFASTAAVFGDTADVYATERAPIAPYGASKTAAEVYVRLYNRLYNMACTTAVFSNIYGPRQAPGRGAVNPPDRGPVGSPTSGVRTGQRRRWLRLPEGAHHVDGPRAAQRRPLVEVVRPGVLLVARRE